MCYIPSVRSRACRFVNEVHTRKEETGQERDARRRVNRPEQAQPKRTAFATDCSHGQTQTPDQAHEEAIAGI